MMKNLGFVYIIVGVIGFLGGLIAAYANLMIGEALAAINSQTVPAGTDISTLQASAQSLGTIMTLAWIWIVAVIIASVVSAYFGVKTVREQITFKK